MSPSASAPTVRVVQDAPALHQAAVEEFARRSEEAAVASGRFTVALAGGSTPRGLYELLAREAGPYRGRIAWDRAHLFWGDERHVPPDHKDSNYRMTREALLARVPIPDANVHRIPAERPEANAAAREYEATLRSFFGLPPSGLPRLDLALLGLGSDGHTASLFPGSEALGETSRLVVAPFVPALKAHRITMTLPVLNNSAFVLFLVSGRDKAQALKAVLESDAPPPTLPARAVRPDRGTLLFLVDRAAAALLQPR